MRIVVQSDFNDGLQQFKSGLTYDVSDEYGRALVVSGMATPETDVSKMAGPLRGSIAGFTPMVPGRLVTRFSSAYRGCSMGGSSMFPISALTLTTAASPWLAVGATTAL